MTDRPPVGTKVVFTDSNGLGHGATVVPTGKDVPPDEIDVMDDYTGKVRTIHIRRLDITTRVLGSPPAKEIDSD